MARFTKTFSSNDPAALITAVNAFLNTLVAPTVRGVTCLYNDTQRFVGGEYFISIDYSDGGAALATPFQLNIFQRRKNADLDVAVQAFITANPLAFFPAVRYAVDRSSDGRLSAYIGFAFYNTTAGASANWLPQ
jgi:hypothetical protein